MPRPVRRHSRHSAGRAAGGQILGFHHWAANKDSGPTWNTVTLDRYLTSPQAVVPKTTVPHEGLNRASLFSRS
jgi:cytochrome c2